MKNTASEVWNSCLSYIKDNINKESFKTWFLPIKPIKLKEKTLTIEVPSKFFYEWIEENYIDLLTSAIKKQLGNESKLVYSIMMENIYGSERPYTIKVPSIKRKSINNPNINLPSEVINNEIKNPFIVPGLQKLKIDSQLSPNYTFSNFIEGDCNRLARSAGYAVSKNPAGTSFNPLLIYGGVGLGKTHLANAIGVEIKERFPEKTALYVSAEKFTQQFIESIRNNTRNDFVHFYQLIDVLIIDDIHDKPSSR